jgi:DNA repair protein RadC
MPKLNAAFWEWFGKSVVRNEDGTPKVVYHGTNNRFSAFKLSGMGIHIGTKVQAKAAAHAKGGSTIMPVYARIENPMRLFDWGSAFDSIDDENWRGLVSEVKSKLSDDQKDQLRRHPYTPRTHDELVGLIDGAGHDGIVYENEYEGSGPSFIAFSPSQIKSINNDGTWDRDDPDIGSNPPNPPIDIQLPRDGYEVDFKDAFGKKWTIIHQSPLYYIEAFDAMGGAEASIAADAASAMAKVQHIYKTGKHIGDTIMMNNPVADDPDIRSNPLMAEAGYDKEKHDKRIEKIRSMGLNMPDAIRAVARAYIDLYGLSGPKEINRGMCAEFAADIESLFKDAESFWDDELFDRIREGEGSHKIIVYGGRHYDAEHPDGWDADDPNIRSNPPEEKSVRIPIYRVIEEAVNPLPEKYAVQRYRVSLVKEAELDWPVSTMESAGAAYTLARAIFEGYDREAIFIFMLDQKHKIIGINLVSMGSLTESLLHPRELLKPLILANAAAFIFVHNHPSGDPTPSRADRQLTDRIKAIANLVGIRMLDSVIAGESSYYSFVESGALERLGVDVIRVGEDGAIPWGEALQGEQNG